MDGALPVRPRALRDAVSSLLLHAMFFAFLFVFGRGMRTLFTDGLSSATARFLIGSAHTLTRIEPFLARIEGLIDQPDELGFTMLGEPDHDFFGIEPPPTPLVGGGDPGGGSGTGGTSGASGGGSGTPGPAKDCDSPPVFGDVNDRADQILAFLRGEDRFTPEQVEVLACMVSKTESIPKNRVARLVDALSAKPRDAVRPGLQALLNEPKVSSHHRVDPAGVAILVERYDAEQIASRMFGPEGPKALRDMLPKAPTDPADPGTEPGTDPGGGGPSEPLKGPDEDPNVRDPDEGVEHQPGFFDRLRAEQAEFEVCLGIQERIQKAFDAYSRTATSGVDGLDLSEMKDLGFLSEVPYCPGAGRFRLIGAATVGCALHGSEEVPWRNRRLYERYYRRYELARAALAGRRPREALFIIGPLLAKQPFHGVLHEVRGDAYLALNKQAEAAQSFYAITKDIWKNSAYHLFHAGMSFYASGNQILAQEQLSKLVHKATYRSSRRRVTTRFEFYRLQEKARWVLENFLTPTDEDGRNLEPVRYLEFKVRPEPAWQVSLCRGYLAQIQDRIEGYVRSYYDSDVLRRLKVEIDRRKEKLAGLQPAEVGAREELERELVEFEEKVASFRESDGFPSSGNLVRDLSRLLREEGIPAHPGTNYRIDPGLELHCVQHPGLLEQALTIEDLSKDEDARDRLNISLSLGVVAADPGLRECYDRQKTLWDLVKSSPPPRWDPRQVARQLGADDPRDADCPYPEKRTGGYALEVADTKKVLACGTHGSRTLFLDPETGLDGIQAVMGAGR